MTHRVMAKPQEITAVFRAVTPMFIGDARGIAPDIRPPAVRGALRFWWRALQWSAHRSACDNDVSALQSLHAAEARLFGSPIDTDGKGNPTGGQGAYLLRVRTRAKRNVEQYGLDSNSGLAYIGYGIERGSEALPMDTRFDVRLIEKPGTGLKEEDRDSVRAALKAWGLFGGLGARARRAFGSVAIEKLDDQSMKVDCDRYLEIARDTLETFGNSDKLPPFTALSKNVLLQRVTLGKAPGDAHECIGSRYKDRRKNLRVQQRVALGTPIRGVFAARRASPIFMHIHPVQDHFLAVALCIPARLHPKRNDRELEAAKNVTEQLAANYTWGEEKP